VRGLRFISSARGMRQVPTLSEAVAARAAEHGWHVQFYPQQTDIIDNADRLLALPNRIVLDHFASVPAEGGIDQPAFKTVLRMLDSGRVWLKLSGPMRCSRQEYHYTNVAPLARALVAHAPQRVVWGSDWPHDLVDLIADWIPDAATRRRILVDSPCELYGFPMPG
jgi:2-pyrone-4,6-dicarboxylate lactonase